MPDHKKILVTGGTGMVGQGFTRLETNHELVLFGSQQYDLRREQDVCDMMYRIQPDAIIHLAAKVGGVKGNSDYVADFFYDNIIINTNVLETAKNYKIPKVVSLLSTCVYPDDVTYPLTEGQVHDGEPHHSNFGYAYAKRMLDVHSRAIRQQHDLNYITAIPNNLYGIHDNFDLENGHVLPAIIRKVHEAKLTGKPPVFWGSGRSLREFTYADDIAKALLILIENYDGTAPVNIGKTGETSIWSVVRNICKILEYDGKVIWDINKPEGQHRKPSSNDNFLKICPDFEYTSLELGLKKTCSWFMETYPDVRGVE